MTMGMIAISCILMKTLLCSYGLSMMDELGQYALGFSAECGQAMHDEEAEHIRAEFSAELAEIKTSFCHNSWYVVGIVSVLSGIIAYFVSWRSLSPLRDFAAQIDGIRMHSIDNVRIDEDSITEFRQLSRSFNKMLVRISRAYDAQRQFTGNAAHELRTPLALMQTQLDTYAEGDSSVSAEEAIAVLRDQTERLSKVVRTLLDMSELQSVPRTDRIDIGPMVEEVYPAVRRCDALVMLCANYNDALSANLTACVNRLTALFRQTRFYDKRLFGLVVSGYSGGDLLARQLISALNMNKSFFLPPHFCLLETANERGSLLRLPGIRNTAAAFAREMMTP